MIRHPLSLPMGMTNYTKIHHHYIDGLLQECSISSVLAMEMLCVSNGDTVVLHWAIDVLYSIMSLSLSPFSFISCSWKSIHMTALEIMV